MLGWASRWALWTKVILWLESVSLWSSWTHTHHRHAEHPPLWRVRPWILYCVLLSQVGLFSLGTKGSSTMEHGRHCTIPSLECLVNTAGSERSWVGQLIFALPKFSQMCWSRGHLYPAPCFMGHRIRSSGPCEIKGPRGGLASVGSLRNLGPKNWHPVSNRSIQDEQIIEKVNHRRERNPPGLKW